MNNKHLFLYLLLPVWLYSTSGNGQVNFLGEPGLIHIPSAEWMEDKHLSLSFSYLPREYSIFNSPGNRNTVNFYNARVGFTSFMEVNLSVAHRPLMADEIGIGDRQLDFRFRLLKEKKYLPAVAFGWTPPGSVSPVMAHDYLVATKHFITGIGVFEISAGYGSPYVFVKNSNAQGIWDRLKTMKKSNLPQTDGYLSGFFGGINYQPVPFGGIMLEYNAEILNAGVFVELWDRLQLQVYTLEGEEAAFQFAYNFPLNFQPRTLRRYEKKMD